MIGRVEVTLKAEDCRGWRQQIEELCHRTDQQRHFKGYLAPPWRRMMLLCVNKTRRSQGASWTDGQTGGRAWMGLAHIHTHALVPLPLSMTATPLRTTAKTIKRWPGSFNTCSGQDRCCDSLRWTWLNRTERNVPFIQPTHSEDSSPARCTMWLMRQDSVAQQRLTTSWQCSLSGGWEKKKIKCFSLTFWVILIQYLYLFLWGLLYFGTRFFFFYWLTVMLMYDLSF